MYISIVFVGNFYGYKWYVRVESKWNSSGLLHVVAQHDSVLHAFIRLEDANFLRGSSGELLRNPVFSSKKAGVVSFLLSFQNMFHANFEHFFLPSVWSTINVCVQVCGPGWLDNTGGKMSWTNYTSKIRIKLHLQSQFGPTTFADSEPSTHLRQVCKKASKRSKGFSFQYAQDGNETIRISHTLPPAVLQIHSGTVEYPSCNESAATWGHLQTRNMTYCWNRGTYCRYL